MGTGTTRRSPLFNGLYGVLVGCFLVLIALLQGCGEGSSVADIRALHKAGRFEESIEPLQALLALDPDSGEASFLLGNAYFQVKKPSLAVWPLRKAQEDPAWLERAGVVAAMALIQSNNNEQAISTAGRVIDANSENLEALGLRAQARLAAGTDLEEGLADIERVLELDPDNETALQPQAALLLKLERIDEASVVIAKIEEDALSGKETGRPALHWCITSAIFAKEKGELGLAEERFEGCLQDYPGEKLVLREVVRFYTDTQRMERAEELLRDELDARPGNLDFADELAGRLMARGAIEESTIILQEALAAQPKGREFDALWRLFEHYEKMGDFESAASVLQRAARQSDDPRVPFRVVDVLIRAGLHARALEAADKLEGEVYVELARGRILLEQGKPKEALKRLQAGIRLWPNNPGARYYTALAAEQIGNFDLAIAEYRDSVRSGADATDAGLRLAQLLSAQGDLVGAINSLGHHRNKHKDTLDSLVLYTELASKLSRRGMVDEGVSNLAKLPGGAALACGLEAEALAPAGGQAAVIARLRDCELDFSNPSNLDVLHRLVQSLLLLGAPDRALKEVDAAIAKSSAPGAFQPLRALVLRASNTEIAEVRAACQAAVDFDPNEARNLACLARVEGDEGNTSVAVALYDRAALADPSKAEYPLDGAILELQGGDSEDGVQRLKAVLRDHPYDGRAASVLARYWVEQGEQLALAETLAKRAVRFRAGPASHDTLGWVQLELGDSATAVETLTRAVAINAGSPSVRYRLARALAADGRTAEAQQALSQALETENFPERDQARADLERLSAGG